VNIYIGYKYKNNKDKETLQNNLEKISGSLEGICNKCFVLGRDVHGWHINHVSTTRSITLIISNIKKSEVLFAFIDHRGTSLGLTFEAICAKIFGKTIILAVKNGLPEKFFRSFTSKIIEFENIDDLLSKIPNYFQNLN
jgi:hypothetical protein